jgi:hypothetical protein
MTLLAMPIAFCKKSEIAIPMTPMSIPVKVLLGNHFMINTKIFSNEKFAYDDVRVRDPLRDRDLLLTYIFT